jgi:hypothetical protein
LLGASLSLINLPIILAGTPTATEWGGRSAITSVPAPKETENQIEVYIFKM